MNRMVVMHHEYTISALAHVTSTLPKSPYWSISANVARPSSSTAAHIFSTSAIWVLQPPNAIRIQKISVSVLCRIVWVKNVSALALRRLWNLVLSRFNSASDIPSLPGGDKRKTTRVKDLGVTFSKISDLSIVE